MSSFPIIVNTPIKLIVAAKTAYLELDCVQNEF